MGSTWRNVSNDCIRCYERVTLKRELPFVSCDRRYSGSFAMLVFDPNRATLVMERREMDGLVRDLEAHGAGG